MRSSELDLIFGQVRFCFLLDWDIVNLDKNVKKNKAWVSSIFTQLDLVLKDLLYGKKNTIF